MKSILWFVLTGLACNAFSQETEKRYPVVGEQVPDFTLSEVYHFSGKSISSKELKDKYLILDFWTLGCVVCIEGFPKINELQKKFPDDIQFMLVGKLDRFSTRIRQVYERVRSIQKIDLPVAYDSALFDQFGIQTTPHIVITDPDGMVVAVTSSEELTEENIHALVTGRKPSFKRKYNRMEEDPTEDVSDDDVFQDEVTNIPKDGFIHKSIITRWNREMPIRISNTFKNLTNYRTTCMSLSRLYLLAYTGYAFWRHGDSLYNVFSQTPIFELTDPLSFADDLETGQGLYNYFLLVPSDRGGKKEMMRMMQHDMDKFFGYQVRIETRNVPCLKLKVTVDGKSKLIKPQDIFGQPSENRVADHTHISLINSSIHELLSILYGYHFDKLIIDDTGLSNKKINLEINALLTDFRDTEKALKEKGLLLVADSVKMQVLVISDHITADRLSNP